MYSPEFVNVRKEIPKLAYTANAVKIAIYFIFASIVLSTMFLISVYLSVSSDETTSVYPRFINGRITDLGCVEGSGYIVMFTITTFTIATLISFSLSMFRIKFGHRDDLYCSIIMGCARFIFPLPAIIFMSVVRAFPEMEESDNIRWFCFLIWLFLGLYCQLAYMGYHQIYTFNNLLEPLPFHSSSVFDDYYQPVTLQYKGDEMDIEEITKFVYKFLLKNYTVDGYGFPYENDSYLIRIECHFFKIQKTESNNPDLKAIKISDAETDNFCRNHRYKYYAELSKLDPKNTSKISLVQLFKKQD